MRSVTAIAVYGDSIANGLGARGGAYPSRVSEAFGARLHDFTAPARTVEESEFIASDTDIRPDVVIIAHGTTEAIVRPTERSLRFLPRRWRRLGWMDPRPYYSSRRSRRAFERIESGMRWRFKNALIRLGHHRQLVGREKFESSFRSLVDRHAAHGARVVVVLPADIDGRYFPLSVEQLRIYAAAIPRIPGVEVVVAADRLEAWGDYCLDHMHPNESGHVKLAKAVISILSEDRLSAS